VADITISVDNATFDQWTASLSLLQRSYLIPLVFTASIPGVASPPAAVDVTGERLLLDVGRACSRPEILDDPGRLFAVLRYASAVSDRYPVFTLTKPFWRLDTHKKKVLSDEFGCGAAFLLASELFGATTTIDLETAVANGWIATLAPKSRRPDYAVRLPTGGLVILEAKGTQSGPSYASDQLTAGCLQVAAVQVTGPGSPQIAARVASALSLSFEQWGPDTTVFVGDPPEAQSDMYDFREDVARVAQRSHYSRVAAFIGDRELAGAMSRVGQHLSAPSLPMSHTTLNGTSYLGTQLTFEAGQARLRFFVGIEARLRQSLLESPLGATLAALPSRGAKFIYDREVLPTREPAPRDRASVQPQTFAAASDGTVWITTLER